MRSRVVVVVGMLVALATALAACGDSGGSSASLESKFPAPTAAPDNAQQGGDLTVLTAGDVDYIDPGAAYYQFSYMIDSATQRQLVSWQPDDVENASPDLATEEPTVSDDGLTITFHLRDDVKFSPPVNRAVVCDDFKYAIERGLLPGVANGYVGTYMRDITGLKEAQKAAEGATKAPDIKGLQCPDDQTFVIKLDKPSSPGVLTALSLPVGAPVPRDYAAPYDAENPSTYGTHQVATGPYMVENDDSGELTGYTSGKEIKLVRNPNWDPETDWRPAYLDSIDVQEGFTDTVSASKKILQGDASVNGDFSTPPDSLKDAAQSYPDQLTLTPSGGNRYVALNNRKPPFDDINVRKATIAGVNRTDLRNTRGGELVGPVATHFIPPNFAGFEEAGGVNGPDLDYIQNPNGDAQVSADYFKKAGMSSGKCEGECDITMVGDDAPPGSDTATVLKDELENLGFNVSYQKVAHDVMYTKFCNVPETEPEVCPNVGWIKDFQDPQSILQITFNGEAIVPSNNSNWPLLDVPEVNKAIDQAVYVDDPDARAEAWGKIDDQIMEQAPAIPWVWDNQANIESGDVAGVINQFNANWDLSFTSLK